MELVYRYIPHVYSIAIVEQNQIKCGLPTFGLILDSFYFSGTNLLTNHTNLIRMSLVFAFRSSSSFLFSIEIDFLLLFGHKKNPKIIQDLFLLRVLRPNSENRKIRVKRGLRHQFFKNWLEFDSILLYLLRPLEWTLLKFYSITNKFLPEVITAWIFEVNIPLITTFTRPLRESCIFLKKKILCLYDMKLKSIIRW